jgi:adenylate cyclase
MAASLQQFWQELKRRKVIRVAVAYAIVAWIVVEVASVLLPTLLLPEWSLRLVTVLALLGFPVALVLAWVFELTPEGGARLERPSDTVGAAPQAGTPVAGVPALPDLAAETPDHSTGDTRRSIVVLPFANLSDDTSQGFFSDGMTEEILALLAKLPNLRVVSRTTSFALRDSPLDVRSIARTLNVELVLEGSVRRAGSQVRIMAQLIDPEQDAQLWSDQFDRELTDIFAVQGEIARSIVGALNLDPDCCPKPDAATQELEAYDYYLRGLQYFYSLTESGVGIAREMFQRAIDIDPAFARAYAGLANAESTTAQWFDHSPARLEAADRASRTALELAPGLAEAHSARGYALTLSGDFAEAAREFESALNIEPGNYEALYLFARSRFAEGAMAEAAALFRQAHETQPDEFDAVSLLVGTLRAMGAGEAEQAGATKQAIAAIQNRLELSPDDPRALNLGCNILVSDGRVKEGLEMARRLLRLAPNDASTLYNITCAFANAGRHDEALDLLERRVGMGGVYRQWVERDPDLAGLRDHPRFKALLDQMSSPRAGAGTAGVREGG